jgi:penicillin amidase
MVKALKDALAFLADPAVVGVAAAGGFGTDDMSQWLWGKLHTVTLKHALGGEANIPPAGKFPEGYPRHGDNFVVDAANPGLTDTSYTFSSGAAIRNVFVLQAGQIKAHMVIPGGQDGAAFAPHYSDLFYLWAKNETVAVPAAEDEVLAAFESCSVLKP